MCMCVFKLYNVYIYVYTCNLIMHSLYKRTTVATALFQPAINNKSYIFIYKTIFFIKRFNDDCFFHSADIGENKAIQTNK